MRAGLGFATAFAAGFFAGDGLETGPAGVLVGGLFRDSHVLLEADCGAFEES
jgi:regulator of RNase E activity RraA